MKTGILLDARLVDKISWLPDVVSIDHISPIHTAFWMSHRILAGRQLGSPFTVYVNIHDEEEVQPVAGFLLQKVATTLSRWQGRERMIRWLTYLGIFLAALMIVMTIAVLVVQRVSDGPLEFLQGGPFRTGELVEEPVTDWSFGVGKPMAFELVGFGTSRTAGYIMHDGVAYMTCDLGYMWNRLDSGYQRWLLNLIYVFKRWHKDAVEDGRALLRIDGKLYKTQFVKVEDPELIQTLKDKLEVLAREYFAPRELGPPPTEPPNDIWFFRMDPGS